MQMSYLLMQSLFTMAAMAAIGYFSVKVGFLTFEDSRSISALNLYLISSCVTLTAFQVPYSTDKLRGLIITFVAAVAVQLLYTFLLPVVCRLFKMDGVDTACVQYSNAGNLLVPLVQDLLGPEFVLYTCSFRTVQLFLIWLLCPATINPGTKPDLKKAFLNPNVVCCAVGLVLFFTGLRIPGVAGAAVDKIGATIGPMCMLNIGVIMANADLKKMLLQKEYYLVCFGRLIFAPALFIAAVMLIGPGRLGPGAQNLLLITLLACAAPISNNVSQMARLFGGDAEKAGAVTIFSTVLAVFTMPLMSLAYLTLCG